MAPKKYTMKKQKYVAIDDNDNNNNNNNNSEIVMETGTENRVVKKNETKMNRSDKKEDKKEDKKDKGPESK